MVICYYSDDRYAQVTGVSVFSLLKNNEEAEYITVYVIDDGITDLNKEKFKSMFNGRSREIVFVEKPDINSIFGECQASYRNSLAIYAKLILYRILPDTVDKVLFLDSDTLVLKSLVEVYSIDMDGMYVAGVDQTIKADFFAYSGLPDDGYMPDSFLNGGFYLQNLKLMRESKVDQCIINTIKNRKNKGTFNDEAIVGYVFRDKIIRLSPIYNAFECFTRGLYKKSIHGLIKKHMKNVMPLQEWKKAFYDPVAIHFPGSEIFRPFVAGICAHPYEKVYRKYVSASPWQDTELLQKREAEWKRILIFVLYRTFPYLGYLARYIKYYL